MKILIVEDQPKKLADLRDFSRQILGVSPSECTNYSDACDLLEHRQFDWIFLDMSIPFEGEGDVGTKIDAEPLGGKLLLREAIFQRWKVNFIVVTQYAMFETRGSKISIDELRAEIEDKYSSICRGIISYQRGESTWKEELRQLILS